ncbi:tetratricopeptide repeat protein [Streptomyces sp. NPDC097941]|uniref:tetratricopeptide repeat protein n=1 Tax=Streptomyces sp. NPDC097941 TaxID=3155685 RepID=UPI00331A5585
MNWDSVVAVTGADGPGSGYLVGPRLVLTSGHVGRAEGRAVTVFRPGRPGEFAGTVVWCGTRGGRDDAALVLIDDPHWVPAGEAAPWGRTVTHRTGISCACWGVPNLVQRPGRPVDVSQLSGRLNAGDRMVGDRYVMQLDGHPPDGPSPWGGLSGAAVFCGDLLTGVIATDPAGRAHAALEAVPAYVLLRDPLFRARLAAHGGSPVCRGVELRELDDPSPGGATAVTPAGLLTARRAVVPFLGRDEELNELQAWAALPGTAVWLLYGPGGQGKTRLAQRFGGLLAEDGWAVVWPRATATADELSVIADVVVPTLVVVDYAEGRVHQLAALLGDLAHRGRHVKVLLLARTGGDWWQELAASGDAVADLTDAAAVHRLPLLEPNGVDLYTMAVDAYAAALRELPGGSDADWEAAATRLGRAEHRSAPEDPTVLAVQMTALADLLDTTHPPDESPLGAPRGPEDRVLDHERRHWHSLARAHGLLPGLSLPTLIDTIAVAALLGAPERQAVDAFLTRVPGLSDQPLDRLDAVRAWLTALYPAADRHTAFGSLQPDRLAERLVGRLILDRDRRRVMETLIPHIGYEEAASLLTVCARAAAHRTLGPEVAGTLTQWCVDHARTLAAAAIAVATQVESPAPLLTALTRVARESDDVELLRVLGNSLPATTEALSGVGLDLSEALVPHYRRAAADDPERYTVALAMALLGLSDWHGDAGHRQEALEAASEGVDLLRRTADSPTAPARAELALGLNRLASRLRETGRHQEALEAVTEATDIFRELTTEDPELYALDLAGSLNTLSSCLATLRRHEDSLTALVEAVDLLRGLADEEPACLPALADALHNLANRYNRLGLYEDAPAPISESVEIRRVLAELLPDGHVPGLAIGLNTLAIVLGDVGRHEEALAAITEAEQLFRTLSASRPGVHDNDLARALHNLSGALRQAGRPAEALTTMTEAVQIRRALAERSPEVHNADLALSLHDLGLQISAAGAAETALPLFAECVLLRVELAQALPETYVHDLVLSFQSYAQCCIDADRHDMAITALDQIVDLRRQIAEVEDDHATQDPEIEKALDVRAWLLEQPTGG